MKITLNNVDSENTQISEEVLASNEVSRKLSDYINFTLSYPVLSRKNI